MVCVLCTRRRYRLLKLALAMNYRHCRFCCRLSEEGKLLRFKFCRSRLLPLLLSMMRAACSGDLL